LDAISSGVSAANFSASNVNTTNWDTTVADIFKDLNGRSLAVRVAQDLETSWRQIGM